MKTIFPRGEASIFPFWATLFIVDINIVKKNLQEKSTTSFNLVWLSHIRKYSINLCTKQVKEPWREKRIILNFLRILKQRKLFDEKEKKTWKLTSFWIQHSFKQRELEKWRSAEPLYRTWAKSEFFSVKS